MSAGLHRPRPAADLLKMSAAERTEPAADAAPRPVLLFGSFRYGQYFEDILTGVVGAAERAGGSVVLMQAADGVLPSSFEVHAQDAVSRAAWDHVDGAIVVLRSVSDDYVRRLKAAGKYVVAIGQEPREAHAAATIDNAGGIRQAISHLAEHGHRRIAFCSPAWQADSAERHRSYRAVMADLGLEVLDPLAVEAGPEHSMDEQGYLAGQAFAAHRAGATAVLVAPDRVALGFLRAVQDAGIRVPDELAVVGVDDIAEAAVSNPPLATVAISFADVGAAAYDAVLGGVRGRRVSPEDHPDDTGGARHVVPQRMVPRESCGCGAGAAGTAAPPDASPVERFAEAVTQAGLDAAIATGADRQAAAAVACALAEVLTSPGPSDRARIATLGAQVVALCPLDRSVTAVLAALRALGAALAEQAQRAHDLAAAVAASDRVLDVADAVRTAQLQQRLADYAEVKRLQGHHYSVELTLLGHDRGALRGLSWLADTPTETGALALWSPPGQTEQLTLEGLYDRHAPTTASCGSLAVQAFPPSELLADPARNRLVVISQVRFDSSDWGLFAAAGGQVMRSPAVQMTLQKWAVLMSASLDSERAYADLARQGRELQSAYDKELALLDEVRVSEERYALAAEAAQDALWDWDLDRDTVFYSPQWKALIGHHDDEIGNAPQEWLDRIHPEDVAAVREQLAGAFDGTSQYLDVEHRLRTSTGEYRWIACSGRVVSVDGRTTRVVGSISDVTVRRVLQDRLVHEALFDPLTGLAKKTLLLDRLAQSIEHAKRRPGYRFAVLFLDLDGFKAVNDTRGHAAGDELLAGIAERLRGSLRSNDTAARLGGDEFAILLDDVDLDELPAIVERFRQLVVSPFEVSAGPVRVGVSIGTATSLSSYLDAEAMLHDADLAMYREKRTRR